MLIIPFIHKITNDKDMSIHNIRMLTIGGKNVWEESDDSDINTILKENDIYCKRVTLTNNIYVCEVDLEKTNMSDMYHWREIGINDTTFCWRDYVFFIGKNNEDWLTIPKNEKIGDIYINTLLDIIQNRI